MQGNACRHLQETPFMTRRRDTSPLTGLSRRAVLAGAVGLGAQAVLRPARVTAEPALTPPRPPTGP